MKRLLAIAVLAFALPPQLVWAQQSTPEPVLNVTIDPPRVVVGERTTLRIDVLAPNYMTSPPELPDFQVRNAVTRQLQSVNLSEERNGTSYAGVRFEFAIYPQEPGSFAISDKKVKIRYAAEPPAGREEALALPAVSFSAFIPDAAAALNPYLAARGLTVEQSIQRSSEQLRVGDSVTRTIRVRSGDTPAVLLPPLTFPAVDGLAIYPSQPSFEEKTDGRTDVMTSTRTDSATYMLQRPGDYELPAIELGWWNVESGKVELARLDAVPLKVAANPAAVGAAPGGQSRPNWMFDAIYLLVDHWPLALLGVLVVWFSPGVVRWVAAQHRRRQQEYLQSEAFAFSRFRRAVSRGDAKAAYFAMLDWLPHVDVGATTADHTVEAFKVAAGDPLLDHEIDAIEAELFAARDDASRWSQRQLLRRVRAARQRLWPRAGRGGNMRLPQQLNPVGNSRASTHVGRRPAR